MEAPVLKVRRTGHPFRLRRAPAERRWMDESEERYAYRCLPVAIANQLGWEVLCPADLAVMWNGGKTKHDIAVGYRRPGAPQPCFSHFGEGVVTFNLGALFTTNPGWQLQIRGPANRPKRGIAALEGVVETEWLPFTSTMNWQVTEPGRWIPFEVGEPIATVVPVRLDLLEAARVELLDLDDDPALRTAHDAWAASRQGFLDGLEAGTAKGWQKAYTRGVCPVAGPAPEHRTKLRLAEPLEAR